MMKISIKEKLKVWKKVFSNFRYPLILIAVAFGFYSFNVFIGNSGIISSIYSSSGIFAATKMFFTLFLGFGKAIKFSSYISLVAISLLIGILVSLTIYKVNLVSTTKIKNKKAGFFATTGAFLGAFAPGCPACGLGIASLLGISTAFLTFLPFQGLELSVLAIGLLSFSIVKITNDFSECGACQVFLNK